MYLNSLYVKEDPLSGGQVHNTIKEQDNNETNDKYKNIKQHCEKKRGEGKRVSGGAVRRGAKGKHHGSVFMAQKTKTTKGRKGRAEGRRRREKKKKKKKKKKA